MQLLLAKKDIPEHLLGYFKPVGFKPKDLINIPAMVAEALRADGWYLRSEVIWHKKAPMPESVTDRPTKAHEQVFLLSKSAKYFYDADAIREPLSAPIHKPGNNFHADKVAGPNDRGGHSQWDDTKERAWGNAAGRNKRSVWTLAPEPYREAHFATMPTKLVEPCILAGTSAHGCCAACGAPWARVTEHERVWTEKDRGTTNKNHHTAPQSAARTGNARMGNFATTTTGWQPTCLCNADVVPCTVLDCFSGASTTGLVALKHGRKYIGLELNPDYLELSRERLERIQPLLFEVTY